MATIYDWLTLAIFAGLIVLFLQRSAGDDEQKDASLLYYLAAGAGCGVTNYLGNHGYDIAAVGLLLATIGFILYFLKPITFKPHA